MKKLLLLSMISALSYANVDSFMTLGQIQLPNNNFLISNEFDQAKNLAETKASRICQSEVKQVSDWKIETIKKQSSRIFGEPAKHNKYVQASAFFTCEIE